MWNPGMSLEDAEKFIINKAISFYGSEEKAAISLKISFKDIKKKLSKYQDELDKFKIKMQEEEKKQEDFILRSRGIA